MAMATSVDVDELSGASQLCLGLKAGIEGAACVYNGRSI